VNNATWLSHSEADHERGNPDDEVQPSIRNIVGKDPKNWSVSRHKAQDRN